jgi:dTDP-glucose 4,6-dehydratase
MEEAGLNPYHPFAASKAGAEIMAMSFYRSYGMPVLITRSCENYGPYQGIENFVPSCICNALSGKPLSLKNDEGNSKELIYVIDHCIALIRAMFFGKPGEAYNIASEYKVTDQEIAGEVLRILGDKAKLPIQDKTLKTPKKSIINSCKARFGLNWTDKYQLEDGLKETIKWYMENEDWWKQK